MAYAQTSIHSHFLHLQVLTVQFQHMLQLAPPCEWVNRYRWHGQYFACVSYLMLILLSLSQPYISLQYKVNITLIHGKVIARIKCILFTYLSQRIQLLQTKPQTGSDRFWASLNTFAIFISWIDLASFKWASVRFYLCRHIQVVYTYDA